MLCPESDSQTFVEGFLFSCDIFLSKICKFSNIEFVMLCSIFIWLGMIIRTFGNFTAVFGHSSLLQHLDICVPLN
jgi:hypothetical protein